MVYGTPQPGYNGPPDQGLNLTSLMVGDFYELFTGAETPSNGLASVAIVRATAPGFVDNGITFVMSGAPSGCHVDVQSSNLDIDGDYLTLATLNGDTTGGNDAYTDVGRSAFYRVKISAYSSGAMPIVSVQR